MRVTDKKDALVVLLLLLVCFASILVVVMSTSSVDVGGSDTTTSGWIGVGFGTAGLGGACYDVTLMALEAGFRKFDTAEADWWYDQKAVGLALKDYFSPNGNNDECIDPAKSDNGNGKPPSCDASSKSSCEINQLEISTKIPPWKLTSSLNIRQSAKQSREELLGFCEDIVTMNSATGEVISNIPYPLDVYYIHAPQCWNGWHPRCNDAPKILNLRDAWMAMESVVGLDHSAKRIGLSNVRPDELLDIITFVQDRQAAGESNPPPRMPDVLQAFSDPLVPSIELRKICQQYNIEFVSYSTLGTQHRNDRGNPVLTSPIITNLANKYQRSVAEVVLSWALQNNMSIIPRSSKKHHIDELARLLPPKTQQEEEQNLYSSSTFLSKEDMQQIDTMSTERRR